MANFPSTVPLRYPVGRTIKSLAQVVEFLDGTEQRWRAGAALNSFALQFADVPKAHIDDLVTWFEGLKGSYDTAWSLTTLGETFTTLALEADELTITEGNNPGLYTVSAQARQVAPSGSWPSVTLRWPALASGCVTQRPWTGRTLYRTTRNDLASGPRVSYFEWPNPRRGWNLTYPAIAPAEALAIAKLFVFAGGRWGAFTMIDPEDCSTEYENCRFDADELTVQYVDAGQCSVSVPVIQFPIPPS